MTDKATKRLRNFDFSGGNAAVALVHEDLGGAANGFKTLLTKSTDVVVELSMAEFLSKFFDMWSGDAAFVARMLGYSDTTEGLWDNEELEKRVHLLKRVKESVEDDSDERFPLTMGDLSEQDNESLRELTKALASSSNVEITDLIENEDADGVSDTPVGENVETPNEVNKGMTDTVEMIEKSTVEAVVAKAVADALSAVADEKANIEKALTDSQEEVKQFKAAQVEVEKAKYVEKAKGYEAVGVEDFDAFGVALMKMAGDESLAPVLAALDKGLNIAKNADAFEEQGHDLQAEDTSGVMAALKARGSVTTA